MIKVFEGFSGIGTQRMALRNLGIPFEVVAISEIDKYALQSYELIHGDCPNLGDISKLSIYDIPNHDLFTYSFPCQSVSAIGKQDGLDEGSGTESSLLWECKRVISGKRPKYLLMENVKNLVGDKHRDNFYKWLIYLESLGYTNYWEILNATEYNVAQNRERVFVVSIHGEHKPFKFPEKVTLTKSLIDYIDPVVDEKYIVPHHCMIGYKNKKSIFRKRFRLRNLDEYAYCLTAKSGRAVITNNYIFNDLSMYDNKPCDNSDLDYLTDNKIPIRALSPNEYFRLQGISNEDFKKVDGIISDAQLYKLSGNAIPIPIIEGIFRNMFMGE